MYDPRGALIEMALLAAYPFYIIFIAIIYSRKKGEKSRKHRVYFFIWVLLPPVLFVGPSMFGAAKNTLSIYNFNRAMTQACTTEQKLTVYSKIPPNAGILFSAYKKIDRYLNLRHKFKNYGKVAFLEKQIAKNHFNRYVYKHSPLLFDIPKKSGHISKSLAQYKLIYKDISNEKDKEEELARFQLTLTDRKTSKLIAEYVGFYPLSYRLHTRGGGGLCAVNNQPIGRKESDFTTHFFDLIIDDSEYKKITLLTDNKKYPHNKNYDGIWPFKEGLATVLKNNKKGFINEQGHVVIPIEYEELSNFKNKRSFFRKGNKWGFIDTHGNVVVPAMYDYVLPFENGLAAVKKDGHWGAVNSEGKLVIPLEYDKIDSLQDDRSTDYNQALQMESSQGIKVYNRRYVKVEKNIQWECMIYKKEKLLCHWSIRILNFLVNKVARIMLLLEKGKMDSLILN